MTSYIVCSALTLDPSDLSPNSDIFDNFHSAALNAVQFSADARLDSYPLARIAVLDDNGIIVLDIIQPLTV